MLEIIIAALLALGIISSPEQANQSMYNQNQMEVDSYIVDTDIEQI